MSAVLVIIYLAVAVVAIAGQWKVFEKAGEPGWQAIIPIWNVITLLRIVNRPWWWLLLMLIPIVNLVIAIIALNRLSRSFGQGTGFTIGLILLPIVFYPILGFGAATYTRLTD